VKVSESIVYVSGVRVLGRRIAFLCAASAPNISSPTIFEYTLW
jgi:hypothetical protein